MALTKKIDELPPLNVSETGKMTIHKAQRKQAKMRLGICGTSGTGKTYGALLVARGLGEKILLVDTESGSGDLYAGVVEYDVLPLEAPYTIEKYIQAIEMGEQSGYDVIILDSISHAWAGSGGLLERQNQETARSGNSYQSWAKITPLHTKFVDKMLATKCHLIATMRSKPEYAIDKDATGRTIIRKLGLAPIQREGLDHEMTIVFDIDSEHNAYPSKDRTGLFDGKSVKLSEDVGKTIKKWLDGS